MNEGLITSEEKNRLKVLFSRGFVRLDILSEDQNKKALSEAWKKAQETSEALKDMKSVDVLSALPRASRAYAKLFAYLGLIEGLGMTLIDITSLLLIASGSEMHFRRGGGILHVSKFKDLHKLNLYYKLEFLDAHKYGFVSKIVNRDLRNKVAHLGFTIREDGQIRGSDGKEIDIDAEIEGFWKRVGEIIKTYDEGGFLRFIEQRG